MPKILPPFELPPTLGNYQFESYFSPFSPFVWNQNFHLQSLTTKPSVKEDRNSEQDSDKENPQKNFTAWRDVVRKPPGFESKRLDMKNLNSGVLRDQGIRLNYESRPGTPIPPKFFPAENKAGFTGRLNDSKPAKENIPTSTKHLVQRRETVGKRGRALPFLDDEYDNNDTADVIVTAMQRLSVQNPKPEFRNNKEDSFISIAISQKEERSLNEDNFKTPTKSIPTRDNEDFQHLENRLTAIENQDKDYLEESSKAEEAKRLSKELLLPPAPLPFFGAANDDPLTIIVGLESCKPERDDSLAQRRLIHLKSLNNKGFGVVPITNSFTISNFQTKGVEKKVLSSPKFASPEKPSNANEDILKKDLSVTPIRKQSSRNQEPPSPMLPTDSELEFSKLILYQVGFPSGRQGLFQGLSISENGEDVSNLVSKYIVLHQDDGVDIGILRGFEPLNELIPKIPELPFMRILRAATATEIGRLELKAREEAHICKIANTLLQTRPQLSSMTIQYCEFQYDHNKLIIFVDMKHWLNFNEFVKTLHCICESEFGYQARIFMQRRFPFKV